MKNREPENSLPTEPEILCFFPRKWVSQFLLFSLPFSFHTLIDKLSNKFINLERLQKEKLLGPFFLFNTKLFTTGKKRAHKRAWRWSTSARVPTEFEMSSRIRDERQFFCLPPLFPLETSLCLILKARFPGNSIDYPKKWSRITF